MKIRRFLCLLLGVCLLGAVCACGDSGTTQSETDSADSSVSGTDSAASDGSAPTGEGVKLKVTVTRKATTPFRSTRPRDPSKEDISLILVIGQSNFTTSVGYSTEMAYYESGKGPQPEAPIVPAAGTVYTSYSAISALSGDYDMSTIIGKSRFGGVTPSFGNAWNSLTGTKVVFIQKAMGSVGVHEWTPDPSLYQCTCSNNGGGTLYADAVASFRRTYDALSKQYNIAYAGYIWNQGEHDEHYGKQDGVTISTDQAYYDAYKSMHEGLMKDLGLDFGAISVVRSHYTSNSMSLTIARSAQYRLCNDIDNLYMMSTLSETCNKSMMDQSNTIHYSQKTFNIMGTESAKNLAACLGLTEADKKPGVQVYTSNAMQTCAFDSDGKLISGTNTLRSGFGQYLFKLDTLGTAYTLDLTLTADGVDKPGYVDKFGAIDWNAISRDFNVKALDVVCEYVGSDQ